MNFKEIKSDLTSQEKNSDNKNSDKKQIGLYSLNKTKLVNVSKFRNFLDEDKNFGKIKCVNKISFDLKDVNVYDLDSKNKLLIEPSKSECNSKTKNDKIFFSSENLLENIRTNSDKSENENYKSFKNNQSKKISLDQLKIVNVDNPETINKKIDSIFFENVKTKNINKNLSYSQNSIKSLFQKSEKINKVIEEVKHIKYNENPVSIDSETGKILPFQKSLTLNENKMKKSTIFTNETKNVMDFDDVKLFGRKNIIKDSIVDTSAIENSKINNQIWLKNKVLYIKNIKVSKPRRLIELNNIYDSASEKEEQETFETTKNFFGENSIFRLYWQLIVLLCILYSSTIGIFNFSFLKNTNFKGFYYFFEVFIENMLIFDISINFLMPYYRNSIMIYNKKKIFFNYLKGWFVIDVLSAIPIFTIFSFCEILRKKNMNSSESLIIEKIRYHSIIINQEDTNFHYLRLFRYMRMLKLLKFFSNDKNNKIINEIIFNPDSKLSQYCKLSLMFFLLIHVSTCLWITIGLNSYSGYSWIQALQNNWEMNEFELYISSLYFNLLTIYTVGYGDIVSKNEVERIYTIFFLSIGNLLFSFGISYLSFLFANLNELENKYKDRVKILEDLNEEHEIPKNLYEQIKKTVKNMYSKVHLEKFIILDSLPLGLKRELILCMHKKGIANFDFFKEADKEFIIAVFPLLKTNNLCKDDILIPEGAIIEEIYLVNQGVLSICLDNSFKCIQISQLKKNFHFGDILIHLNEKCPYLIKCSTITCEYLTLSKSDYFKIGSIFKKIIIKILESSCEFLEMVEKMKIAILSLFDAGKNADEIKFIIKTINSHLINIHFDKHFYGFREQIVIEDFFSLYDINEIIRFSQTKMTEDIFRKMFLDQDRGRVSRTNSGNIILIDNSSTMNDFKMCAKTNDESKDSTENFETSFKIKEMNAEKINLKKKIKNSNSMDKIKKVGEKTFHFFSNSKLSLKKKEDMDDNLMHRRMNTEREFIENNIFGGNEHINYENEEINLKNRLKTIISYKSIFLNNLQDKNFMDKFEENENYDSSHGNDSLSFSDEDLTMGNFEKKEKQNCKRKRTRFLTIFNRNQSKRGESCRNLIHYQIYNFKNQLKSKLKRSASVENNKNKKVIFSSEAEYGGKNIQTLKRKKLPKTTLSCPRINNFIEKQQEKKLADLQESPKNSYHTQTNKSRIKSFKTHNVMNINQNADKIYRDEKIYEENQFKIKDNEQNKKFVRFKDEDNKKLSGFGILNKHNTVKLNESNKKEIGKKFEIKLNPIYSLKSNHTIESEENSNFDSEKTYNTISKKEGSDLLEKVNTRNSRNLKNIKELKVQQIYSFEILKGNIFIDYLKNNQTIKKDFPHNIFQINTPKKNYSSIQLNIINEMRNSRDKNTSPLKNKKENKCQYLKKTDNRSYSTQTTYFGKNEIFRLDNILKRNNSCHNNISTLQFNEFYKKRKYISTKGFPIEEKDLNKSSSITIIRKERYGKLTNIRLINQDNNKFNNLNIPEGLNKVNFLEKSTREKLSKERLIESKKINNSDKKFQDHNRSVYGFDIQTIKLFGEEKNYFKNKFDIMMQENNNTKNLIFNKSPQKINNKNLEEEKSIKIKLKKLIKVEENKGNLKNFSLNHEKINLRIENIYKMIKTNNIY